MECERQNVACELKASLEAAELALGNRAGAGDNGLPVLSNTTLELTFTGAGALISESADGFFIPSADGQGETLEEMNRQCPWITGELGACAMLADVQSPAVLYSCSVCGGPPGEQGLCDGECWDCFMHSQTKVVNELCKDAGIMPVPAEAVEGHCDHPKTFCCNGNVTVDYVENYWCPICDEKIDLGCAGDCNACCKQPCNGDAVTGYDSSSSSLSREDEYVEVPRNVTVDFENATKVQLCSG